jgi:hypothetical protein
MVTVQIIKLFLLQEANMRAEGGYHFKLEDIECCDKLADLLVDMVIKKHFQTPNSSFLTIFCFILKGKRR